MTHVKSDDKDDSVQLSRDTYLFLIKQKIISQFCSMVNDGIKSKSRLTFK